MHLSKPYFLVFTALLSGSVASIASQASTFDDPLLDRLAGHWVLRGEIANKKTTHDITAEWVLDHQYLRIHEVSREKKAGGQPAYEAMVFIGWVQESSEYACMWLDSTMTSGFTSDGVGRAKRRGDEIPFIFKDSKGQITFLNTFSYDKGANSWSWKMDNVNDGQNVTFGRVKLTRK